MVFLTLSSLHANKRVATHLLDRRRITEGTDLNSHTNIGDVTQTGEVTNFLGPIAFERAISVASADMCQGSGKETILLVEDEEFVRKATGEALEWAGYRVAITGSAMQALEVYGKCHEPIDLVVSDVVMPGMSGHELADKFVALFPQARILLMSGYAEQLMSRELSPYHREYMAKPFSIPTLLKRVREVLDRNPFDFPVPLNSR
jgi:CheY-like chemotaxis protein